MMKAQATLAEKALTVSQYNSYINECIGTEPVLVEGEASNCREIPGRNFRYFDIKDKSAVAKCFQGFWNSEKVKLENGMLIRVFGYPSVQRNGSLVIDIRQIFFVGEGDLMMNYLQLKEKLDKEGLFDQEKKKELPCFPNSVGLIAGKNSSAYHDVVAELGERWPIKIYFCPSKVQGIYAKQEIGKAIRFFNSSRTVDVLIIARGGGSMEELQAFDSEEVVREIFASKIPTISAIGHEDHWTLADYVADKRAKTPTKAAEIAVPSMIEIKERLEYYQEQSLSLIKGKIKKGSLDVEHKLQSATMLFAGFVRNARNELDNLRSTAKKTMSEGIKERIEKLSVNADALRLLNPQMILERGYAVVEIKGKRIGGIDEVCKGDKFSATLHDGLFEGTINHKKRTHEINKRRKKEL